MIEAREKKSLLVVAGESAARERRGNHGVAPLKVHFPADEEVRAVSPDGARNDAAHLSEPVNRLLQGERAARLQFAGAV